MKTGAVTVLQLYAERGTEPVCIGGIGFAPLYEQRTSTAKVLQYTKASLASILTNTTKAGYMRISGFDLHNGSWKTRYFLWQNQTLQEQQNDSEGSTDREVVKDELIKVLEDNVHAFIPRPTAATPAAASAAAATKTVHQ